LFGKSVEKYLIFVSVALAVLGQFELSQADEPGTLLPGLFFYGLATVIFLFSTRNKEKEAVFEKKISAQVEWIALGIILLLAAFLRLYHLDTIPSGVYIDSSGPAVMALRILTEHWHPPFLMQMLFTPSPILYLLAFWFRWFTPTQFHLFLFFSLFSLAAFPLIYWFFRQLIGPPVALVTLYFLTVMRWHIVFSRNGFFGIRSIFYAFACLAFLTYGLRSGKKWAFILSGVFLSCGLYTYQSFKAFPLLVLICLLFECWKNPSNIRSNRRVFLMTTALCFVMCWPVVHSWIEQKTLGIKESMFFIGKDIVEKKSLSPLMDKTFQTMLVFNRTGGTEHRFNYQNHRMLDDITGIFFILGFFYALIRIRERSYFYAISGFFVLSLPEILVNFKCLSKQYLLK
jgi:hypothetical protein